MTRSATSCASSLSLIRRHRRLLGDRDLANRGHVQEAQTRAGIEELDGKRVLIQEAAGDRRAVAHRHSDRTMIGSDVGAGIDNRSSQLDRAPDRPDLGERRSASSSHASDAVAVLTLPLACEERLALRGVARNHAGRRRCRERSQVGNDRPRLSLREIARRHRGAGDAAEDDLHDLVVSGPAAELAAAQIDRRHAVAVWSVAGRAIGLIQEAAVLDVGGRVPVALLRVGERCPKKTGDGQDDDTFHHAGILPH